MSDVEIRPTIPADLDALAGVLVRVHEVDGYPVEGVKDPAAWLALSDPIGEWTALLDGRPVGHVAILRPAPEDGAPKALVEQGGASLHEIGVLARLFVDPGARGKSCATKLLCVATRAAAEAELHLVLDVMKKDVSAIRLYLTKGWRPLAEFEHLVPDAHPHAAMALELPPRAAPK